MTPVQHHLPAAITQQWHLYNTTNQQQSHNDTCTTRPTSNHTMTPVQHGLPAITHTMTPVQHHRQTAVLIQPTSCLSSFYNYVEPTQCTTTELCSRANMQTQPITSSHRIPHIRPTTSQSMGLTWTVCLLTLIAQASFLLEHGQIVYTHTHICHWSFCCYHQCR